MRTLCGHISLEINVRTMSAQHLPRETYISFVRCCVDIVPILCGHSADIYLQGYMSAHCPHYILLRFTARPIVIVDPATSFRIHSTLQRPALYPVKESLVECSTADREQYITLCLCVRMRGAVQASSSSKENLRNEEGSEFFRL